MFTTTIFKIVLAAMCVVLYLPERVDGKDLCCECVYSDDELWLVRAGFGKETKKNSWAARLVSEAEKTGLGKDLIAYLQREGLMLARALGTEPDFCPAANDKMWILRAGFRQGSVRKNSWAARLVSAAKSIGHGTDLVKHLQGEGAKLDRALGMAEDICLYPGRCCDCPDPEKDQDQSKNEL